MLQLKKYSLSGHRGTRVHEIENSRLAFDFCLQNDLDYIEFDVMRTVDNQIVVFHDKKVNRLLNGDGYVEKLTLTQLRDMEYADGQKIQTLEEFFKQVGKKIRPMLEIKSRHISEHVINVVHSFGYKNDEILIQSFDVMDIRDCYRADPQYDYGLCMGNIWNHSILKKTFSRLFYTLFLRLFPYITWLNLDGPYIFDEFIDVLRGFGKRIILGANHPENYLHKLERWGVEIIIFL